MNCSERALVRVLISALSCSAESIAMPVTLPAELKVRTVIPAEGNCCCNDCSTSRGEMERSFVMVMVEPPFSEIPLFTKSPVVYKDYVNLLYLYYHVFTSDFLFQLDDATITAARRSKFRLAPFCPTRVSRMVTKTNGFRNLPESRRLSVRSNPSLVVRHGGGGGGWGRALRA